MTFKTKAHSKLFFIYWNTCFLNLLFYFWQPAYFIVTTLGNTDLCWAASCRMQPLLACPLVGCLRQFRLYFSVCVWYFQKPISFCVVKKQIFSNGKNIHVIVFHFNPFPNKPWFLRVCRTSLLKTLLEKEKLLIMSNFSFSHSVFYLFRERSAVFIKSEIVVCKLFQFGSI